MLKYVNVLDFFFLTELLKMDSKCFEIERVMEGTGNLIENRFTLSFPLGLVLGWGAPYSFFLYFYPK